MKATIRRFHSPDVYDLEGWVPADPACFGFLLQALIGPADGEGEESFDFIVCSPEWLKEKYGEAGVILGRHHIIMFDYNFEHLRRTLESLVARIEGKDWRGLATRIARYGAWEFEDYSE
ncbi:MAG TPA: immunity 8 family protein [Thermoanaerobaculia bacterium]|jgi:hypothetical protein|nr:immunity 8 family protein [Thermoanaerobaculia bacterium]